MKNTEINSDKVEREDFLGISIKGLDKARWKV